MTPFLTITSRLVFTFISFILWLSSCPSCFTQVPITDLYVFNLDKTSDNRYHIYQPKFLSGFNPGGYTNQPYFIANGDLMVSVRKTSEVQNDIYLLSPSLKIIRRLTQTAANEFSPRLRPDGEHISVVRQVEGDSMDQQLYQFPRKGGNYIPLTGDFRDIGYYAWMSENELGLFRLEGDSNFLMIYHTEDQKGWRIASSVGRSLFADDKGALLYVHKFDERYWYLKKYDTKSTIIDIVAETPGNTEDFALSSDGTYFMAKDEKLYFFNPKYNTTWQVMADVSIYGILHITRLAISQDSKQIAVVSTRE